MARSLEIWNPRFTSPWREMMRLQDRMNRIFENFVPPTSSIETDLTEGNLIPSCDMIEEDSKYVLKFDLPGVAKENVNVSLDGQTLTVAAERKEEKKKEDARSCLCEVSYGSYSRSLTLPESVSEKQVDAKFENGVLTVTVPKSTPSKTKHIAVH